MPYQVLDPIVSRSIIAQDQFSTLPSYLQPHVAGLDHIWFIVIVPQADTDPVDPCRVVITAAANNRTGTLKLENNGRLPVAAPPANMDDLRPISFYVWNTGSQTFRVRVSNNSSHYKEVTVSFN